MVEPAVGKRQAHKEATHQALKEAADRLFAERGFAATTVRDIAAEAGVTERTFFRYFAVKEELIVEDVAAWIPVLAQRIRDRPAGESPLIAIERAVLALADEVQASSRPSPALLFLDGPPAGRLRMLPVLNLRLEQALAEAISERSGEAATLRVAVTARAAASALRSVMLEEWQVRSAGGAAGDVGALVREAFAVMRTLE